MSVTFSVSEVALRPFLNTIQCASKLGDGVFFVAHKTFLEISSLSNTSSCHLLASIPSDILGGYRFTENATGEAGEDEQVFFYLLARSLQATVLHQSLSSLRSLTVSFSVAPQEGETLTDSVQWDCFYAGGVQKSFHLRTATGVPTRVCTDGISSPFKVCGDPQTFGYLLASLPGSAGQCIVFPLANRIELRYSETSSKGNDRFTEMPGAASTALVSAYPSNFDFFECVSEQQDGCEIALPGKMVELKPVKVGSMLCKNLGLRMQLESGYERSPIVIRSITQDALHQMTDRERFHGGGSGLESYVPISFVMHLAGLDVSYSEAADDNTRRETTGVTARNTVSPKRGSAKLADNLQAGVAVRVSTPSKESAIAGTPSVATQDRSVVAGSAMGDSPDGRTTSVHPTATSVGDAARGLSTHGASQVTHVDASYVSGSANDSESASRAHESPRATRTPFTAKGAAASGTETPGECTRHTTGSVVADSQVNSGRQSMTVLYPLDFEAFTRGSADDEKEEIDEDLQRFLDSCTAMLMGEADRNDEER